MTNLFVPSDPSARKLYNRSKMGIKPSGVTKGQLHFWKRNGFLVIEEALDQDVISAMMADVHQLAEKFVEQRSDECKVHHITEDTANIRPNGRLLVSPTPGEFVYLIPC